MKVKDWKINILHSLTGKITIYFTIGFTGLWILCNSLLFIEFRNTLWDNFDQQMLTQAKVVADNSNYDPKIVPLPQSNENYLVLYENDLGYIDSLFAPPKEIQQAILTARNVTYRAETDNDGEIIVVYTKSDEEVKDSIHRLDLIYYASLAMGTILAFVLSMWVAKKILKPIKQLAKIADTTDLKANPTLLEVPKSNDELKQLIIAFNRMLLRIKEQSDLQNTFFASASHELRTPLSIMQGQLQILMQDPSTTVQDQAIFKNQLTEVKRLVRTVNDFLLMSELLNNKVNLTIQEVDLSDILTSILSSYQNKAKDRQLKFKLSMEPLGSCFVISSDYDKVYTIFFNLVGNAIKYAPENSLVSILVNNDSQSTSIQIENKIDHPIANLSALQNSFYHSKPLKGEGSGLGLWIVNQLCEILHCHFEISQSDSVFQATIVFGIRH